MSDVAVSVARKALANLGGNFSLNSFDDNTREARLIREVFDDTRDTVLREFDWNFARQFINPSPLDLPSPTMNYEFVFAYPSDCLRILALRVGSVQFAGRAPYPPGAVYDDNNGGMFQRDRRIKGAPSWADEGRLGLPVSSYKVQYTRSNLHGQQVILTNIKDIELSYTGRVEDVRLWDADFSRAFSYWLASVIAPDLTNNLSLTKVMHDKAMFAINAAKEASAQEGEQTFNQEASWIQARGG